MSQKELSIAAKQDVGQCRQFVTAFEAVSMHDSLDVNVDKDFKPSIRVRPDCQAVCCSNSDRFLILCERRHLNASSIRQACGPLDFRV
jgi:hypothetical protein